MRSGRRKMHARFVRALALLMPWVLCGITGCTKFSDLKVVNRRSSPIRLYRTFGQEQGVSAGHFVGAVGPNATIVFRHAFAFNSESLHLLIESSGGSKVSSIDVPGAEVRRAMVNNVFTVTVGP